MVFYNLSTHHFSAFIASWIGNALTYSDKLQSQDWTDFYAFRIPEQMTKFRRQMNFGKITTSERREKTFNFLGFFKRRFFKKNIAQKTAPVRFLSTVRNLNSNNIQNSWLSFYWISGEFLSAKKAKTSFIVSSWTGQKRLRGEFFVFYGCFFRFRPQISRKFAKKIRFCNKYNKGENLPFSHTLF